MNPEEMRELVLGMRCYTMEFEVSPEAVEVFDALEEAYEGELGQPPGEPLEEVA